MGGWVHTAEFHKYLTSSTFESLFSLTFLCNNFPRLESLELRCLFCCLVQLFFSYVILYKVSGSFERSNVEASGVKYF